MHATPRSAIDRRHLFRGEASRKHDLQHFDVVAVAELAMTDARRLMDARASFEADDALAFVLEFDPSLEDVDKLEFGSVQVRLAGELLARCGPDDMSDDASLRRAFDSQVPILVERAEAPLEPGIFRVRGDKAVGTHGLSLM